jgi:hypothetical protein
MKKTLTMLLLVALAGCAGVDGATVADDTIAGQDAGPGDDAVAEDDTVAGDDTEPGEDTIAEDDTVPSPELHYPVVDTGLVWCFDANTCGVCPGAGGAFSGQDSMYQGHAPDYEDNGDGTVTDRVTGLMWQQDPGAKMTWFDAVEGADSFSLADHDDWRLPSIKELYSLILFDGLDPSGCETAESCPALVPFIDSDVFAFEYGDEAAGERLIDAQFATTTEDVSTTMGGQHTMFGVNFADGRIKGYPTAAMPGQPDGKLFFVLYVRGDAYGVNDFEDAGDGTIVDHATGLTWLREDSGAFGAGPDGDGTLSWAEALAWCEELSHGGHDDWRLPDAKELQSIVDYTRSPATTGTAAIDPVFAASPILDEGGAENFPFYWSGTTHAGVGGGTVSGGNAAYVAFGEALGFMSMGGGAATLMDVHGAGAQRSDPKFGDPADYPTGHGPQGDVIRIFNHARCVRGGPAQPVTTGAACPEIDGGGEVPREGGPVACEVEADCAAADACPPEAGMGCTCATDPMGQKMCVPLCQTDDDCPLDPVMSLICAPEGICVPEGGPPR